MQQSFWVGLAALTLLVGSASRASAQPKDPLVAGKNLDHWIREISSPDASQRESAIQNVLLFGTREARRAVPALLHVLKVEGDISPKVNAVIAIGEIGLDGDAITREGVTALSHLLVDSQGIVKYQAAMALGKIGPKAAAAIPNLRNLIGDRNSWKIRQGAAWALGRIALDKDNGPDSRAVTALSAALRDYTVQVRLEALQSIILLGPPRTPEETAALKKALTDRLVDRDKGVTIWARMALMRIDKTLINNVNLTAIAKLLKDPEQQVRMSAATALGVLGKEAKPKLAELVNAAEGEDLTTATLAIVALAQIKEGAQKALPALEKLKSHKEPLVAAAAADAIAEITGKKK